MGRGKVLSWRPKKEDFVKRPSPVLYVFLILVFLISQFSVFTKASEAASITKSSSADWDLGTNSNVTTTGGDVKLAPNDKHSWYSTGGTWNYRKKIVIDKSKVSGADNTPITNFPVLVNLASDAGLASNALDNGNDILFTSNDEKTKLSHEIESFDGNTGALIAWVKLPYVSKGNDTVFYMYYGNAGSGDMRDKTGVWSNGYAGVWHYKEGSGTSTADSTTNNNTGTLSDVANWDTANNSKIGNGTVKGYASNPDSDAIKPTNITFSAWIKAPETSVWPVIGSKTFNWNFDKGYYLTMAPADGDYNAASFGINNQWVTSNVPNNQWLYITGTYDLKTVSLYINGSSVGTPISYSTAIDYFGSSTLVHGGYWHGGIVRPDGQFAGSTDEFRISSTARSASWIATEYNNQNDPATFYSLGSEVAKTSLTVASDNISNNWYQPSSGAGTDWKYRRKVTVDYTKVSADQYDFPMLVKITDGADPVFSQAQTDGDDILFTNAYGDKLSHEIEKFDTTGKELWVWVNAPNLSSTANTSLYMYYGNSGVGSQQAGTYVWSNGYAGVWHLKETSGQHADSTSNNNISSTVNVSAQGTASGKIAGTDDFNGTSNYIQIADSPSLGLNGNYTISAWLNRDTDGGDWERILSKTDASNIDYWLQVTNNNTIGGGFTNTSNVSQSIDLTSGGTTVGIGSWTYATNTFSGTTLSAYFNGAFDRSNAAVSGTPRTSSKPLEIGRLQNIYKFDGKIDEVRISKVARSTTWISTEYNNQNAPETFYILTGQQGYYPSTNTASWYSTGGTWNYRQQVIFDHTKVSTADQSDFPVLIKITDQTNPIFNNAQVDADDILFTSSNGTSKIPHEIEKFSITAGSKELDAWVKISTLSHNSDTAIFMYYGNAGATNQQDATSVWSNGYYANYHLSQTPTIGSATILDSTSNIRHGTPSGTVSGDLVDGKIGKAIHFDSTNNRIDLGYTNAGFLNNFSFSFWTKAGTTQVNYADIFGNHNNSDGIVMQQNNGALNTFTFGNASITLTASTWQKITVTRSSIDGVIIYINGTVASSDPASTGNMTNYNYPINIGRGWANNDSRYYNGDIDEFQFVSSVRSAPWISTEYANQSNPTQFEYIGAEENSSYLSPTSTSAGSGIIDFAYNLGWKSTGTLTSSVTVPANTSIAYYGRTSAVGGSTDSDWSAWSTIGNAATTGTFSADSGAMPAVNRYLQVKAALISDGTVTPTLSDYTINYITDTTAPTNPTTATASIEGSPIVSGGWVNTAGTTNFTFSGATDSESGVAGYYTYLGTSDVGDPVTYQAHTGVIGDNQSFTGSIADGGTYYFRVKTKDTAGNTSSAATLFSVGCDTTAPVKPNSITANPAGYASNNSFDFSWPDGTDTGGSGVKWYEYKRATDPAWSHTADSATKSVSGLLAYQEGANAFYVRTVDIAGNPSSTYTQVTYYWSGEAPPKPNNVAVSPPSDGTNSFTISWDKPDVGAGSPIIGYYYSINVPPTLINSTYIASTAAHVTVGPDKYATQQGENTVYVVSRDEANNSSFLPTYYATATFSCQTASPPAPTSVSIYDSSDKVEPRFMLTIQWQAGTGQDSGTFDHYSVERSTNGTDYSELATVSNGTSYLDDSSLSDQTTYYYRIKTIDNAGSSSAASSVVSKQPSGKYTTAPAILANPEVDGKATQATITWTTDRASSSFVRYGTTEGQLEESKGDFEATTNHSVTLLGLSGSTKYYFQVQSVDVERDYSLKSAYSTTYSFITLTKPSISNVSVSSITLSSADISWDTTTVASSRLNYGKTTSYGTEIEDISGQSSTRHSTKVTGLDNSSSYHFKIVSTDIDGIELTSEDYSFETLPMPKITNMKIEEITGRPTQAIKVRWETNVPASTIVRYGAGSEKSKEMVKSQLEKNHEIETDGLSDDSSYSIIAEGVDQFGNTAVSEAQTFKTKYDTRKAVISQIQVESNNVGQLQSQSSQMVVSWKTDEPTTSQVLYGEGLSGETTSKSLEDTELKTNHLVIVGNLKSNAIYSFKVISKDKAGNETASDNQIIVAGESRISTVQKIINALNNLFGNWIKI